jgi:hypothetical protein
MSELQKSLWVVGTTAALSAALLTGCDTAPDTSRSQPASQGESVLSIYRDTTAEIADMALCLMGAAPTLEKAVISTTMDTRTEEVFSERHDVLRGPVLTNGTIGAGGSVIRSARMPEAKTGTVVFEAGTGVYATGAGYRLDTELTPGAQDAAVFDVPVNLPAIQKVGGNAADLSTRSWLRVEEEGSAYQQWALKLERNKKGEKVVRVYRENELSNRGRDTPFVSVYTNMTLPEARAWRNSVQAGLGRMATLAPTCNNPAKA